MPVIAGVSKKIDHGLGWGFDPEFNRFAAAPVTGRGQETFDGRRLSNVRKYRHSIRVPLNGWIASGSFKEGGVAEAQPHRKRLRDTGPTSSQLCFARKSV
ncbi:MAG: hypothetical protein HPM95_16750 [Alphaproteobacteria bacterium]|nr:hypothetical protein [Alphaproteobacteria bacterium]